MNTQNLVANLYNPHEQSKEQLIESFVVRRNIFQKLFREIKSSDMKYPEQHFLIVGQRGMGKTTLLLRLGYEVENDRDLHSWLIPLVLKEESYWGITRLFKLWETIAKELENKDKQFSGLFAKMEAAYTENEDYERIIFDILIQELQTHSRKLLLFIDNLAEMFKIFSDMECHRLREILMTCPHMRIIGATAIVLEAFFTYEHAFYEFFKKEHLEGLNKEETRCLLEQLAKTDAEKKTIQHILEHQQGRAEALRIMTGGVLRTIILLFEIFIDNENGNAIGDLESILDRVTPLYKHRMDDLAPMQREVVNAIALNWDAISMEEIAKKMRMKTEEIQPVLQGLDKVEIIQRAAADTQMNLYFLKERFFNIWYLMRVAPKGSQNKVIWLVRFLESWYDKEELIDRAKRHIDALSKGNYNPKGAYYMTEALAWTGKLDMDVEHELKVQTRKFLEGKNESLLADLSPSDKELFNNCLKYYDKKEYHEALNILSKIKYQEGVYHNYGLIYEALKDTEKAEKYWLMAAEKGYEEAMVNLGILYTDVFKNYEKAEKYWLMAAEKDYGCAMFNLGQLYENEFKDTEKAEKYWLMSAEKGYEEAMVNLGILYTDVFKNYEKAEKYWLMAAEKDHADAMFNLGLLYETKFKDIEKAEKYYLMSVEKEHEKAIFNLGYLYETELDDIEKAEKYYLMGVQKGDTDAMNRLGRLYDFELDSEHGAEKYYLMAVKKGSLEAMDMLGDLYAAELRYFGRGEFYSPRPNYLKDYTKAEKYYLMAAKKNSFYLYKLLQFFFEKKIKKKDALKYALQSFEKEKIFYNSYLLAYIYIWNNQYENAISIAKKFINRNDNDINLYLLLLLAKEQYQHVTQYFEDPELNLKERFKPLYYALLHFTNNQDFHKMPPELAEPVKDIIEKVKQMAVDYA
ncbi:MAG: hypothetical protein AB7S75_21230 [Desulfococcaceae bacterium]